MSSTLELSSLCRSVDQREMICPAVTVIAHTVAVLTVKVAKETEVNLMKITVFNVNSLLNWKSPMMAKNLVH